MAANASRWFDSSDETTSDCSDGYLRDNAFSGHRDTLARIKYGRHPAPTIPRLVLRELLQHLTFSDYLSLRSTCVEWNQNIPLPEFPPVYHVPSEIVQNIYEYMSPLDFDAARHTCTVWFQASLHKPLLVKMLKNAGS